MDTSFREVDLEKILNKGFVNRYYGKWHPSNLLVNNAVQLAWSNFYGTTAYKLLLVSVLVYKIKYILLEVHFTKTYKLIYL